MDMKLETIDFETVAKVHAVVKQAEEQIEQIIGYRPQLLIKDEPTQIKRVPDNVLVAKIKQLVADYFNVTVAAIDSECRRREYVDARGMAMYYVRKMIPSMPYKMIGLYFGGRDHSSVITRIRTMEGHFKFEPDLAKAMDVIGIQLQMLNIYDVAREPEANDCR